MQDSCRCTFQPCSLQMGRTKALNSCAQAYRSHHLLMSQVHLLALRKRACFGWRQGVSQAPELREELRDGRHILAEQHAGCPDARAPRLWKRPARHRGTMSASALRLLQPRRTEALRQLPDMHFHCTM